MIQTIYNRTNYLLVALLVLIQLSHLLNASAVLPSPIFPLQFTATIKITSHLIDENNEYPPHTRQMTIYYDYINKKARADIEAGYEAAKIYIRHYDLKNEYMVRLPPINDCKRAYLGETMPFPDIPDSIYIGIELVDGIECNHFLYEEYNSRIHIYITTHNNIPVRLIQEDYSNNISIPLLTYDYSDVELDIPDSTWFDLPTPYEHKTCTKHAGGFPYLHIFHYFIRF